MSWYPDRLMVANIAGRALLSDSYIIGEWRRDPWEGFDIPEGAWRRVKRHEYEPAKYYGPKPQLWDKETPVSEVQRNFRDMLKKCPVPTNVVTSIGTAYKTADMDHPIVRFDGRGTGSIWISRSLLRSLICLIDGEPAEWRGSSPEKPIHALNERGKWLGTIMPVRLGGSEPKAITP